MNRALTISGNVSCLIFVFAAVPHAIAGRQREFIGYRADALQDLARQYASLRPGTDVSVRTPLRRTMRPGSHTGDTAAILSNGTRAPVTGDIT